MLILSIHLVRQKNGHHFSHWIFFIYLLSIYYTQYYFYLNQSFFYQKIYVPSIHGIFNKKAPRFLSFYLKKFSYIIPYVLHSFFNSIIYQELSSILVQLMIYFVRIYLVYIVHLIWNPYFHLVNLLYDCVHFFSIIFFYPYFLNHSYVLTINVILDFFNYTLSLFKSDNLNFFDYTLSLFQYDTLYFFDYTLSLI